MDIDDIQPERKAMDIDDIDLVRSLEETKAKCHNLLAEAAAVATNIGGNSRLVLPNAFNNQVGSVEIIAIGSRQDKGFWPWSKASASYPVFYIRNDYFFSSGSGYSRSVGRCYPEQTLIKRLDENGAWGKFLLQNQRLLERVKSAIEGVMAENATAIQAIGQPKNRKRSQITIMWE